MRFTKILMGMPIVVEVVDKNVTKKDIDDVYRYFKSVDELFSTYKDTSEITKINKNLILEKDYSSDMKTVLRLCEETKKITDGYFDIKKKDKTLDPSGLVKGWAILNATKILKQKGFKNFYVDAGGDIQISGHNAEGEKWVVGIRNPFNRNENVKILCLSNCGIATSGTAIRGQHVYNPFNPDAPLLDIVSTTVIGPDVYEADRFATAAFVMQKEGLSFIHKLSGFEGYMIDKDGIATFTEGFSKYVRQNS